MRVIRTPRAMMAWRRSLPAGQSIGFVPTMGALHDGHLSLVRRARRENRLVVASVFVNPTQFGPGEDLSRYPRPWTRDRSLLAGAGVDVLFAPTAAAMYPPGDQTRVALSGLTRHLCGAPTSRGPGHFVGVATVVAKLFNIVRPARAYFGLKDYQQVRVLEQMTADLFFDLSIVRCPTVRERDGLAMSSRNAYLSGGERQLAGGLSAALQLGAKLLTSPRRSTPASVVSAVRRSLLRTPGLRIDYVELVDPNTLQPLRHARRPALLAAAVRLGRTRLIDNLVIR